MRSCTLTRSSAERLDRDERVRRARLRPGRRTPEAARRLELSRCRWASLPDSTRCEHRRAGVEHALELRARPVVRRPGRARRSGLLRSTGATGSTASKGSDGPAAVKVRGRVGRRPRGACRRDPVAAAAGAARPQPRSACTTVEEVPSSVCGDMRSAWVSHNIPRRRPDVEIGSSPHEARPRVETRTPRPLARCSRVVSRSGCAPLRRT